MTYEKQIMDKSGKVECLTYVHTLNNQSGMKRKLDSLNVFFKLSVTQTKSSHSQSQQHENHDNKVVGVDVIEKVVTDAKINWNRLSFDCVQRDIIKFKKARAVIIRITMDHNNQKWGVIHIHDKRRNSISLYIHIFHTSIHQH